MDAAYFNESKSLPKPTTAILAASDALAQKVNAS